ncbi:MAG TPA: acyl dehydratase [Porticoccaceae bacterium]|nr:acyl dehydratase [Porticoccaceae bacterium]HCO61609.1 acyl dehydratase [Porticoccaceae bacterium]
MALKASELKVGDVYEEQVATNLSRTQIVQYAGASGDYMPLHSDEVYAREIAGYPGVFAHGMLSMGATGVMLTNWVGDGRLTKYSARFTRQVWPGDDLIAKATVTEIHEEDGHQVAELDVVTVNQDDQPVINGKATARLDA